MTFDIPDHAQVRVFIGDKLPMATLRVAAPTIEPAPSRGRPLLKASGVAVLVAVAFLVGQHFGVRYVRLDLASAAGAAPSGTRPVVPEQHAFPERPLPSPDSPPPAPDQVPPAFAQQLRQPPVISPPPGTPPAGSARAAHPFGLED